MKYNNFGRMVHWGCSGPEVLFQNTIWFVLCVHMGMRGRDKHYKLTFGALELKCSSDGGSKYIEFSERDTKTRSGGIKQYSSAV